MTDIDTEQQSASSTPSGWQVGEHPLVSHSSLVDRAGRWLRRTCGCCVVLTELVAYTHNGETPDAIGWVGGKSILVECKLSRADFLRDRKKRFRNRDELYTGILEGMGSWRFFLTAPGIVKESDDLKGWGVYEMHGKQVRHAFGAKYANAGKSPFQPCLRSENAMLVSALRRLQSSG